MPAPSSSITPSYAVLPDHMDLAGDNDGRAHGIASDNDDDWNDGINSVGSPDSVSLSASFDSLDAESTFSHDAQDSQSDPVHPPDTAARAADTTDQAMCRICLESSSSDAAGGESLGRLLSPCRCKGTMKYVHASCLDQWRAASARSSSAVACDQCGAPYRFRKSKFVGLATSPTLLFLVSLFLFLMLIWSVGVVATIFMDLYDKPITQTPSPSPVGRHRGWWPWRTSRSEQEAALTPIEADAWSYLDADYATPGLWSYSNLVYEPAAYIKLIKDAVHSFASGEAVDVVREVVGLQENAAFVQAQPVVAEPQQGFWSALKSEWMYGDGGLWQRSSPSSSSEAHNAKPSNNPATDTPETTSSGAKSRDKYDARAAASVDDFNASKRRGSRGSKAARARTSGPTQSGGWLSKLFVQFSVGFSLVGILSFLNLVILAPINLHNFGLGRSFARMTSRGRGGGRNANHEGGVNLASILIILLVVIGVVRALHVVYKLVRSAASRGLSRLEAVIVDWNHDDNDDEASARHEPEAAAPPDPVDVDRRLAVRHRHAFDLAPDG